MNKGWMRAMIGLGLAIAPASRAGSLELKVVVGPNGTRIHSAKHVNTAADPVVLGAPAIEVFGADGKLLGMSSLPDPRIRSVISPSGGHGETATLMAGVSRVRVPWPSDAKVLHFAGKPLALPSPAPEAQGVPKPPPVAIQIVNSGAADERLDLVFVGDGYTSSQQDAFADDVDRMVDYLLTVEPYGTYSDLFNIWRIEIDSNESGATHEESSPPVYKDTALSCYYGCAGIDRLTCCDDQTVLEVVEDGVPGADGIMVLINDETYGGSGGFNYATSYIGADYGPEVAAHELGHSLVGLWDEYSYGSTGSGTGPNCSTDPTGGWDSWSGTGGVDAFAECSYTNYYRPTDDECMMRTLQDDYCQVCRQEAVLAMYSKIPGLVQSLDPAPGNLDATGTTWGEEAIAVQTNVDSDKLQFSWQLDGNELSTKKNLALSCQGINGELFLDITDPTPWVRDDPLSLLTTRLGPWQVTSELCSDGTTTPNGMQKQKDEELGFSCSTGVGAQGSVSWPAQARALLALGAVRRQR